MTSLSLGVKLASIKLDLLGAELPMGSNKDIVTPVNHNVGMGLDEGWLGIHTVFELLKINQVRSQRRER